MIYTEEQAEKLLEKHVPVAQHILVKKFDEAVEASHTLKFPLVMKIISPDALHKSDVGGVVIVHSAFALETAFRGLIEIATTKKLKLKGIMLQEFVEGQQLVIGINYDQTFGHVLMFGLGGIFVEVLKDVSFRVCPITPTDANDMMNELQGKQILDGARGQTLNKKLLKEILVSISTLPKKYPSLKELDINPFILNESEGKVVDARIVMD